MSNIHHFFSWQENKDQVTNLIISSNTSHLMFGIDRTFLLARLGKKKGETKMGHDLRSQCNYTPIYNSSEPLSSMSHLVVIQLIRDMSIWGEHVSSNQQCRKNNGLLGRGSCVEALSFCRKHHFEWTIGANRSCIGALSFLRKHPFDGLEILVKPIWLDELEPMAFL